MNIVLTNDDGASAAGLAELTQALATLGNVTTIVPERHRSGVGHSMSISDPLQVTRHDNGTYLVSGFPADCVKFALGKILDTLPDLVTPNPADAAEQSDLLGCIEKALPDLSPGRREALHLRFWAGLSVRETAAVMHRREGAVKMLISRAVADLRKRCLDEP